MAASRGNPFRVDAKIYAHKPVKAGQPHFNFPADSRLTIADNILYVISSEKDNLRVFRLSADGDALIPVQGESDVSSIGLLADGEYIEQVHLSGSHEGDNNPVETLRRREYERIRGVCPSIAGRFTQNTNGSFSNGNPAMPSGKTPDCSIPVSSPKPI